jgi:ATP-binding protein involved in chromosome partitioning
VRRLRRRLPRRKLPLQLSIREQTDSGTPTVVAEPDGAVAAIYKGDRAQGGGQGGGAGEGYEAKFPTIVVKND